MSFGRELKDFAATYLPMQQQNIENRHFVMQQQQQQRQFDITQQRLDQQTRHQNMMEGIYMGRLGLQSNKADPSGAAFQGGYNNPGGVPAPAGGAGVGDTNPKPEDLYGYLSKNGATHNEATMLTSAAKNESGFNPGATHDKDANGNPTGYGMFGHRNDRRDALFSATGTNTPTWQQQADFALNELRSRPSTTLMVNGAKNAQDLTAAQMDYERPKGWTRDNPQAGDNWDGRYATTQQYLAQFDPSNSGTSPTAAPAPQAIPVAQTDNTNNYSAGGRVPSYADGGAVDAGTMQPANGAYVPPQAPPSDGDPSLGAALHGGLTYLSKFFGLQDGGDSQGGQPPMPTESGARDTSPIQAVPLDDPRGPQGGPQGGAFTGATQALPSQPNPQKANAARLFMNGLGAASPDEYDGIMKVVDPNGQMDESIRNISGMKAVYEHYLKQGNVDAADKAAASLIQYMRLESAKYADAATQAVKSGQPGTGVEFLKKAYSYVPDGHSVDAHVGPDGNGVFQQKDANGKVISQGPFTPQALLAAATGINSGSMYYGALMEAAGKHLGNPAQPSQAYSDYADRSIRAQDPGQNQEPPQAIPTMPTPPVPPVSAPTSDTRVAQTDDAGAAGDNTQPGNSSSAKPSPYDVPQRVVTQDGDERLGEAPTPPPAPKYLTADGVNLAGMSPAERRSVQQDIAQRNQQVKADYAAQIKAYSDAKKDYDAKFKAAQPKPMVESDPTKADTNAATMKGSLDALIPNITDPTTGKPYGDLDAAKRALGPAYNSMRTIARGIQAYNGGLRSSDDAAAMAVSLLNTNLPDPKDAANPNAPPHDPTAASFKPVGYAPGGNAVVLQASDGQTVVLDRTTYGILQRTHTQMAKTRNDQYAQANKPSKPNPAVNTLKGVGSDIMSALSPTSDESRSVSPTQALSLIRNDGQRRQAASANADVAQEFNSPSQALPYPPNPSGSAGQQALALRAIDAAKRRYGLQPQGQ